MMTISKAAEFIAFFSAVLCTNLSLVQYAPAELIEITGFQPQPESQEVFADEDQAVHTPHVIAEEYQSFASSQQEWTIDSNPLESYSPIEAFDAPHSDFLVELDPMAEPTLFQESTQPDFTIQTSDTLDMSNPIILKDVGYNGPGDMRTHLWNDHSSDLEGNGISHETLMSMPIASVQKWHNYFHGTESAPESP